MGEFVAHALQALSELDPRATIVSLDGVNAFDLLISRRAMMEAGDPTSLWETTLGCSRANCLLRVVRPDLVRSFAERHKRWQCLARILGRSSEWDITTQEVASLLLSLGGLGLRNAVRTSPSTHWARSDSLSMIKARQVADSILHLMHQNGPQSLKAASRAAGKLRSASGFDPPSLARSGNHHSMIWTTKNQVWCVMGGNMRQLQEWSETFANAG